MNSAHAENRYIKWEKQKQKQNMKVKTPHDEFIIWDHF